MKTLLRLLLLCVGMASLFAPTPPALAQGIGDELGLSPYWDWKVIETPNFRLTFDKKLESIARKAGSHLEESHAILTPWLRWTPTKKTQVYILDNTDLANGSASPLQRFGIVLYVTPPEPTFSTAYYDDWLRLLVIHEYTHFVNMDTTRGLYDLSRYVFGDLFLPNSIWPSWMLEGLAVYVETRHTGAGRGRSPYYEMVLRSAVEKDLLGDGSHVPIDRLEGNQPYYPGGETRYLFGYQLMNQVSRHPFPNGRSVDGADPVRNGEDALGLMSYRSGARIPFFINSNLENITGKSWYDFWEDFLTETRARMTADLKKIRSRPLTPHQCFTEEGYAASGATPSPDGQWLAYTLETLDRRTGLYLRDLRSGQSHRIDDKYLGVGMGFTPDSRSLIFSEIDRKHLYAQWSDLRVLDLESRKIHALSDGLRARDPDVSPNGKQVVFSISESAATGIGVANLIRGEDERFSLGKVKRLYWPKAYGRASNPKFSRDGRKVVFSHHPNGKAQEDLLEVELASGAVRTLLSDGNFNRHPAFDQQGQLYFVSNATGVENLWRLRSGTKPLLVSNVTTGLWFPAFGPAVDTYASLFSVTGWNICKIDLDEITSLDAAAVTVSAPPAPSRSTRSTAAPLITEPAENYSIFPSIWPRLFVPAAYFDSKELVVGGGVYGFDAIDRHRYAATVLYNTQLEHADWQALYSNRSFGPTLSLHASESASYRLIIPDTGNELLSGYSIDRKFGARASFPFVSNWSVFTPSIGFSTSAESVFYDGGDLLGRDAYTPDIDLLFYYTNLEFSRLAVTAEDGRSAAIGVKWYGNPDQESFKLFVSDTEHFRITDHSVLVPAVSAQWVSPPSPTDSDAAARVRGKSNQLFSTIPGTGFDQLGLRGYPRITASSRAVAVASVDYRFPIWRIYRGLGTNPFFLDYVSGFVFGETAYFPGSATSLPSAGGGVNLSLDLLIRVPLRISVQYHHGFETAFGGGGELFTTLNLGQLFL